MYRQKTYIMSVCLLINLVQYACRHIKEFTRPTKKWRIRPADKKMADMAHVAIGNLFIVHALNFMKKWA